MKQEAIGSPAISVIVPIYNAEKTLRKCVDSLLAQTFQDFEILLIDDGSPDQCGAICDEYAKQDSRVRVIHQENQGVSAARQCGMDNAQGEYTIHADPDDWVEPNMLEELYKKAKEDDADMVICDFYENTYKGQKYVKQQPSSLDRKIVQKELFTHLHGSCCNKLIRLDSFQKNGVRFPDGISFCEDLYVNAAMLLSEIRVSYLNKAFYHYVKNRLDSLSRRYDENSERQYVVLRDAFVNLMKDTDLKDFVNSKFSYAIVSKAFWGGRELYSSRAFKEHFYNYLSLIKAAQNNSEKYILVFSCYGLYRPTVGLILIGLKIKFIIGKVFSIIISYIVCKK